MEISKPPENKALGLKEKNLKKVHFKSYTHMKENDNTTLKYLEYS